MTTTEHISTYLPDVWEAAHWLRRAMVEATETYTIMTDVTANRRLTEAHNAIINLYIDANRDVTHYAGPEILHALAGTIEALCHAYSDRPGYNPHWSFES